MSIEVYTPDLTNRHEITHAVSVSFSAKYNGIGKMTIVLPIDSYNISLAEQGGIVYDTVRDLAYVIESVRIDTNRNRITLNGYTTNWMLNHRSVLGDYSAQTDAEAAAYAMVTGELRGLPNIVVGSSSSLVAPITMPELDKAQLLDSVVDVLGVAELGHRLRWDADNLQHVFEVYRGQDLTSGIHAAIFSEEHGTAVNLEIKNDSSELKTKCYVKGELTNGTQIMETVGNGDREILIKQSAQLDDQSETDYRASLQGSGAVELSKHTTAQNFSVECDTKDFGTAYHLGDKVVCVSARFNATLYARITGVQYTLDANGQKVSLTIGEPDLTI